MRGARADGDDATTAGGIAFTVVLLAVTLLLLAATADLRAAAAVVPRAVGWPVAVLLAYRLARDGVALHRGRRAGAGEPERSDDETAAVLWLLALPALATALGFVVGPAVWVIAWARLRASESVTVAVGAGVVTALAIHLIFGALLGARLPQGMFGGMAPGVEKEKLGFERPQLALEPGNQASSGDSRPHDEIAHIELGNILVDVVLHARSPVRS